LLRRAPQKREDREAQAAEARKEQARIRAVQQAAEDQKAKRAETDRMRDKEENTQAWIEAVTGETFQGKTFHESLKNGVLLCK